MKKDLSLQKKINEIILSQDIQNLEIFEDSTFWEKISKEEREKLSFLFIKRGEIQLQNGQGKGIDSLSLAERLAPFSHEIFYKKGLVLSNQSENVPCLNLACQAFMAAVSLSPNFFEGYHEWGNALVKLGKIHGESNFFHEASEKFQEAHRHFPLIAAGAHEDFYWNWGQCCHLQGKLSGEADDFNRALEQFENAMKAGVQSAEFWNDYGEAVSEFAFLLGRKESLFDAINFFQNSIKSSPDYFPAHLNLACVLEYIFEIYGDEKYYLTAHEAFEKASLLETRNLNLWLKWGQLHLAYAKIYRDIDRLQTCFEKFSLADACESDNAHVLMRWAEAQLLYGSHQERVDLLRAAERKIVLSLEILPENSESWYIYGTCLNELGRYFQDDQFYFQAIEKFHYGLSINQTDALLWYGLALAHFAIGEYSDDFQMIEKSSQYCAKVLELGGHTLPHFWNDWGVALMKLAEMTNDKAALEAAIEKFEEAIAAQAENDSEIDPECLYNYGCALDFLGDFTEDSRYYEQAVQVLAKALITDPHYTNARYNLALSLSHLGEANADVEILQKSLEHFQILLTQDQEDEMGWNDWGLALLHLALLVQDAVQPQKSLAYFEQSEQKLVHAAALGCTQSFYNLACLYSLMNNYPTAIHYLERAVQSESLPAIDDVLHDEWLEGLRATSLFRHFLAQISNKYEKK